MQIALDGRMKDKMTDEIRPSIILEEKQLLRRSERRSDLIVVKNR